MSSIDEIRAETANRLWGDFFGGLKRELSDGCDDGNGNGCGVDTDWNFDEDGQVEFEVDCAAGCSFDGVIERCRIAATLVEDLVERTTDELIDIEEDEKTRDVQLTRLSEASADELYDLANQSWAYDGIEVDQSEVIDAISICIVGIRDREAREFSSQRDEYLDEATSQARTIAELVAANIDDDESEDEPNIS